MHIVAIVKDHYEDVNGATHISKITGVPMQIVKAGNPLPLADLYICFGNAAKSELLDGVNITTARKQLERVSIPPYSPYVTATYDASLIFKAPEWGLAIAGDVLWARYYAEIGLCELQLDCTTYIPSEPTTYGFDLETTGYDYFDPAKRIVTMAAAYVDPDWGNYYVLGGWSEGSKADVAAVIGDERNLLCGHNIKFDVNWAESRGMPVRAKLWDTMVAGYLIDDTLPDNSLGYHSTRAGIAYHKDMVDMSDLESDLPNTLKYNAIDAASGVEIYKNQKPQIEQRGQMPIMQLLMDLIPVFSAMERRGVYIDQEWYAKVKQECYQKRDEYRAKLPDINLNSSKQLAAWLYEDLGLPIIKRSKKTREPSTDKDTLIEIRGALGERDDELVDAVDTLLGYRKYEKRISSFIDPIPELIQYDGRIHPTYNLAKSEDGGTATGRTSCRNPNLQQIPLGKLFRGMFAATPGWQWLDADYTGLEMSVVADLSRDKRMLRLLSAGLNFHTGTMAERYNKDYAELQAILDDTTHKDYAYWKKKRVQIKRVNFGILYGIGAAKLAHLCLMAGAPISVEEAQDEIDAWFDTYPGVAKWMQKTRQEAIKTGRVTTPTGRIRNLPGAERHDWLGWRRQRQACNTPVQAFASDILLTAMYLTHKYFAERGDAHLLMNVHDQQAAEFKGDAREMEEAIRYIMERQVVEEIEQRFDYRLTVPLKADINVGERWS